MELLAVILGGTALFLVGIFVGIMALFGYMTWRMMRNEGWDDSNITNAERLLSHVVMHPHDFGKMYYLTPEQVKLLELARKQYDPELKRPFWYVSEDELSEVVKSRPAS